MLARVHVHRKFERVDDGCVSKRANQRNCFFVIVNDAKGTFLVCSTNVPFFVNETDASLGESLVFLNL